jgi:hypothetical protein
MAIDTRGQMLRIAELRQMRDQAQERNATLTASQLGKMIVKAEAEMRDLIDRGE